MKHFTILLDGRLAPTARLRRRIAGTVCIAADGGIRHAEALALTPQLWLGDFDSAQSPLREKFRAVPQRHFPREKNKTDGELAIDAALAQNAASLILCGAFGGARADHSLLHMTLAVRLAQSGIACLLTDGETEGTPLIKGDYEFDFPEGSIFSLIGFTEIEGLTIRGAKWNLENQTLEFGSSLALSNESCGRLHISLRRGYGILLAKPHI